MNGPPTVRWPDRLLSITPLRLFAWVILATISHQGVLSDPFKVAEWMDDHQFYSWEQSDRMTLLRWHQLPAWNPYWCGGTVGISAPEDPFFGPDFLLRLLFGVDHGRRLAIFLLVVLGFEGMYRLCRRLDSSAMGSAFAALAYATCERFVSFIHDGWVNFLGFELIPFVLYFLIDGTYGPPNELDPIKRAAHRRRARLFGGFFVAWLVLSAGTYPTPYAMLAVLYVSVALALHAFYKKTPSLEPEAPDRWRAILASPWALPFVSAGMIGAVALGLSAAKMLPTLSFLRQFPRVFNPVETHSAAETFNGMWGRYSTVLLLGILGVVTTDIAAGIFFGGAIFFFALAMGDFGAGSPFHMLKSLPIFGQLRFPDRFIVMVLLFTSVAAARGISRVEDAIPAAVKRVWELIEEWRSKWTPSAPPRAYPPELGWVFVGIAAFLAYSKILHPFGDELLPGVRIKPGTMFVQEGPREYDGPFRQSRGNRRDAEIFTTANLGSNYCVAGNPLPESALLRGDLPQEEYPLDPAKATVRRVEWTPNVITLEVDAKEPTTVLVNQNWARQWTTNTGTVHPHEKLLAVDVPAGKNTVVLAYKDRFLDLCLLISLGTLIALLWSVGKDVVRWGRTQRAGFEKLPTWPDEDETTPDERRDLRAPSERSKS